MATTSGIPLEQSVVAGPVRGPAPIMKSLYVTMEEIARTDIPVLLVGESGTGKEVYARSIHRLSGLGEATLKKVNCAALNTGQLLGELRTEFDSPSGSREASRRTVFFDGVHDLDSICQRALLSLLPDEEPRGLTGKSIPRFISSTSRSLEKEIEAGRFRRELYFRISGVVLRLPPLRDRKEDIPALLEYFFQKHSNELKKKTPELNSDVQELLGFYDWPGNIRELENVAKRILAVGDPALVLDELRAARLAVAVNDENWHASSLKVASRAASRHTERELIQKALERTHWNRKRAAHDLQISYKSLLYKIKQTGLEGKKTEWE
jgi:two-component system, NtrC family, response regulator AtoC